MSSQTWLRHGQTGRRAAIYGRDGDMIATESEGKTERRATENG